MLGGQNVGKQGNPLNLQRRTSRNYPSEVRHDQAQRKPYPSKHDVPPAVGYRGAVIMSQFALLAPEFH
jgi:hypothetical protein